MLRVADSADESVLAEGGVRGGGEEGRGDRGTITGRKNRGGGDEGRWDMGVTDAMTFDSVGDPCLATGMGVVSREVGGASRVSEKMVGAPTVPPGMGMASSVTLPGTEP